MHVRWWPRFIKFVQKFRWILPPEICQPKNIKVLARFRTTLRLDREYLWNATRYRQSENDVANYRQSLTGKLNSVYFGRQSAKNRTGVLTHPMGGNQAGHCHASSLMVDSVRCCLLYSAYCRWNNMSKSSVIGFCGCWNLMHAMLHATGSGLWPCKLVQSLLKPISQLRFDYDTTIPRRIRLRRKRSKLRYTFNSTAIRLWYDYDKKLTLLAPNCVEWKQARTICLENSFPDPFFHSREFGNVRIHSRDSRAPGNDVYCRTTSAVALWKPYNRLQNVPFAPWTLMFI